tara:strand:- start:2711 stop:3394 length:684 start_codon:yes stop_codon:yes gene_type:complete
MSETTQELEAIPSTIVRPAGSQKDIVGAMNDYQDLCVALLDDNDFQTIQGKKFVKRSGMRKLAVAYGVTFEIVNHELFWDDTGDLKAAEFIVRATAPNGRFADGWGACAVKERNAGKKATHDIPATAETRAKNRACADLFGMGEVSAEEVDRKAMTASKDAQQKLLQRINVLKSNQIIIVKELWKDKQYPKLEDLNDDQIEAIHLIVDQVEATNDDLSDIEPDEEAF